MGGVGIFIGTDNVHFSSTTKKEVPGDRILTIHPRFYRWYPDEGEEWLETNTDYATLEWKIPVSNVALVLVDVWEKHYLKEAEDRADNIIENNLVPLLRTCRNSEITVIHAPSAPVAKLHPNWVRLIDPDGSEWSNKDQWPPKSFRNKSGDFQSYARPREPREAERREIVFPHVFHPMVEPVGEEPVVANGEELHKYCRQNEILFLLYAGFNTNACLITRDYGMLQMSNNRGYETILVRDCTTGMESRYSQPTLGQTNGATQFFEMFGQYTVTTSDVIKGIK